VNKRALGWESVLASHMARTEARMAAYPVVLCLQDTNELDFNGQGIDGLGRLHPELPAGMVFDPIERHAGWLLADKAPPGKTPCLREAICHIAMLGGFLARKGDGEQEGAETREYSGRYHLVFLLIVFP
jgi:hypothetical protein